MWTCRRAADMAMFHFGERKQVRSFGGDLAEVGEYALHVQCPWHIVQTGATVVGSWDLHYPADRSGMETVPENFNWDRDANLRDHLLRALFENGAREFVVQGVNLRLAGACSIEFKDAMYLELFPDDSSRDEHWRLISTEENGPELVVVGPSWPS